MSEYNKPGSDGFKFQIANQSKPSLLFDLLWGNGNAPGTEPVVQASAFSLMNVLGLANDAPAIDPLYTGSGIEPMTTLAECGIFSNRIAIFFTMCVCYVMANNPQGKAAQAGYYAACQSRESPEQQESKARNWEIIDLLARKAQIALLHATKLKGADGHYLLSKELLNDAIDKRCVLDIGSVLAKVYEMLPGFPQV